MSIFKNKMLYNMAKLLLFYNMANLALYPHFCFSHKCSGGWHFLRFFFYPDHETLI